MYARIVDGKVAELTEDLPALGSTECALIVEVHDWDVQEGWLFLGGQCVPPPDPTPAELNAALDAQIIALEAKQARPLREIDLGQGDVVDSEGKTPTMRLQALDEQIAALRAQRV